jgi:broad specificity phosphatase PhoE
MLAVRRFGRFHLFCIQCAMDILRSTYRLALLLALIALGSWAAGAAAQSTTTVVYLVRHAEKLDDTADPPLTEAGAERARLLERTLVDAGITRILSSDYERTRDTAAPLAERLGLEVEIYDPRALDELAERIRSEPGRYLVSGHSNTTPALVERLGGDPGEPIREADEYDRLYVLSVRPEGTTTVLLRYGLPPGSP